LPSPSARHQHTLQVQDHRYGPVYHATYCLLPQLSLINHSTYPQTAGSGWADLGAWFCAEVVCLNHSSRH